MSNKPSEPSKLTGENPQLLVTISWKQLQGSTLLYHRPCGHPGPQVIFPPSDQQHFLSACPAYPNYLSFTFHHIPAKNSFRSTLPHQGSHQLRDVMYFDCPRTVPSFFQSPSPCHHSLAPNSSRASLLKQRRDQPPEPQVSHQSWHCPCSVPTQPAPSHLYPSLCLSTQTLWKIPS